MKQLLIALVKMWRAVVSPTYGSVCKFHPSCSAYGLRALQVHGAAGGSWLIIRRLARCHPWSKGGYDPVPGTAEAASWASELAQMKAEAADQASRRAPEQAGRTVSHPRKEAEERVSA